jgi:oligopeptide transport system substrate-binding protein
MRRRSALSAALALVAVLGALGLVACQRAVHRPPCPEGALCLMYGNGAEPTSLDPAHIDGTWEANIVGQLLQGLTRVDEHGQPVPGIASSWETSADGLTWTFHLRDAQWSDGAPVTGDDFVYAVRRELDPKTASYSAFILFPVLKNAQLINQGQAPPTAAGIEAPDPHTVVLHLAHPWPTLPLFAAGRVLWPVPRHVVERWGDAWTRPGHYVSDGPYMLVSWRLGDAVVVRKNPRFWDADAICYAEVDFSPSSDAVSNERLVAAGDLDVTTSLQSSRVLFLRASLLRDYLRVAPVWGVYYLPFNLHDPALRDVRVRQALAMSIDRDFLTRKLLRAGQQPAYTLVPTGIPGYPDGPRVYWASWSLEQRQAEARRLLAAAGYGPGHPLSLTVIQFNTADPALYMPSIQADWRTIGVDASLRQEDVQVAYQDLETHAFQVGVAGWVAPEPYDYLDLSRADTGGQNFGGYANPAYDAELDAAMSSPDPTVRTAHMQKAEAMLLADMPFAPLYYASSRDLVDPHITRWIDNLADSHPISRLCRLPITGGATQPAAAD